MLRRKAPEDSSNKVPSDGEGLDLQPTAYRVRPAFRSLPSRTELVWPGKEQVVAAADLPGRPVGPLEPCEWVGEGRGALWRNRLLLGDNLLALQAWVDELSGQVDLIYLDPPFSTGSDFSMERRVGEGAGRVRAAAYGDRWGDALGAWLSMIYPRLVLARSLLSERGTLYLHLDWNVGHHARALLDEIFGEENSLGEIIWAYGSPSGGRAGLRKLVKAHDLILVYARHYGRHRFRPVHLPYSARYVADWFKFQEEDGRRYRKRWRRDEKGRSYVEKQYLDESRGVPASTVWADIQQVYADPRAYKEGMRSELTGYPTQKPERLLERILQISSEPGDLVADFFCGSGTTLAVAQKLGRRWLGCDQGALAVQTARKRLLPMVVGQPGAAPFEMVDLGAAERRSWVSRLGEDGVRARLLEQVGARPIAGQALHGRRGVRWLAFGPVDGPLDAGVLGRAAEEAASRGAKALEVLGWELEPGLETVLAELRARLLPMRIEARSAPRQLEAKGLEEPEPILKAAIEAGEDPRSVRLKVLGLCGPSARVRPGLDWVDGWSVQWDWRGGPLCADFHAFRTRRDQALARESPRHCFEGPGCYRVLVQAIDLYGRACRWLAHWRVP